MLDRLPRPDGPTWVGGVLFAVAHTQAPLPYSNQNQYLLHGLASAGVGLLREDWLANTADPTPLFSAVVAALARTLGEWAFQAVFAGLLVAYFVSLFKVTASTGWVPARGPGRWLAAGLLVAAHAAVFRVASVRLTGVDYPWYFQSGVAGQYLLGPGLQPSSFGVLLVAGLAAYLGGRAVTAAALTAAACLFHSTYLMPAGFLVLSMALREARAGRTRTAVTAAAVALAVVAPTLWYTAATFGPGGELAKAAHHILAWERIPHHTLIARWLDVIAWLQLAWVGLFFLIARRTPLAAVLFLPAAAGVAFSLAQYQNGDPTLALLFPWRISVVLVPVATAVLLARSATAVPPRAAGWLAAVLLAASAGGGLAVTVLRIGYGVNVEERAVLDYVREHARPGDVFLIPSKFPDRTKPARGAMSASFTPPPRSVPGQSLVAVDLQSFRLSTGAPIFVDFKSIPYSAGEVQEWERRMRLVEAWYARRDWDAGGVIDAVAAEGVTHVVATAERDVRSRRLERVYADERYRVYRVVR